MSEKQYFKPREVAAALCVSRATVCRLCESGRLEAVRVGAQWRIPVRVIDELTNERKNDYEQ